MNSKRIELHRLDEKTIRDQCYETKKHQNDEHPTLTNAITSMHILPDFLDPIKNIHVSNFDFS